jgi:hypothetical protein
MPVMPVTLMTRLSAMRTDPTADSGAVVLVAAALAAVATGIIWITAQIGVVLVDQSRASTAADAVALAAVVWQGADLTGLAQEHGAEIIELQLIPPADPMVDLEVLTAAVTVRYRGAIATARATARELAQPTMVR